MHKTQAHGFRLHATYVSIRYVIQTRIQFEGDAIVKFKYVMVTTSANANFFG